MHDQSQKCNRAWDKLLSRLISYIHHKADYKHNSDVDNEVSDCKLGLFQDADLAGSKGDSKSTSSGVCARLEVIHVFQNHKYAKKNGPQFLTAGQRLKLFHVLQIYAWKEYQC